MKKIDLKHIREIADRLPPVFEQSVSGYTVSEGKPVPNIQTSEVNHYRRLRRSYTKDGMAGVHAYLEKIYKLQIQRRNNVVEG